MAYLMCYEIALSFHRFLLWGYELRKCQVDFTFSFWGCAFMLFHEWVRLVELAMNLTESMVQSTFDFVRL